MAPQVRLFGRERDVLFFRCKIQECIACMLHRIDADVPERAAGREAAVKERGICQKHRSGLGKTELLLRNDGE